MAGKAAALGRPRLLPSGRGLHLTLPPPSPAAAAVVAAAAACRSSSFDKEPPTLRLFRFLRKPQRSSHQTRNHSMVRSPCLLAAGSSQRALRVTMVTRTSWTRNIHSVHFCAVPATRRKDALNTSGEPTSGSSQTANYPRPGWLSGAEQARPTTPHPVGRKETRDSDLSLQLRQRDGLLYTSHTWPQVGTELVVSPGCRRSGFETEVSASRWWSQSGT